jgi:hypothetical protein
MDQLYYHLDWIGEACLKEAHRCKSEMRFGAVLVKRHRILGRGWNRRSTAEERAALSHVDYAIHAEQACVLDALSHGEVVEGGVVYVLGYSHHPKTRGWLTTRVSPAFSCTKCPHTLKRYDLTVAVGAEEGGWFFLDAEEAMASAKKHIGHWKNFTQGKRDEPDPAKGSSLD